MPTISTALTVPPGVAATLDAVPTSRSSLQKASTSSGSSFLDPFNEAAYQEWINSLGLSQQQPHVDTSTIWPTTFTRGNDKSGTDPVTGSMPAYLSSAMRDIATADSMNLSGHGVDDDAQMDMLKVPTNTPTAFMGADHGVSGSWAHGRPSRFGFEV